jgi:hypothetical protein
MSNRESAYTIAAAAVAAARAHPLSRKRAMLAALLVDAAVDAAFASSSEDDPLAFRARLARESEPLALTLALAAMEEGGPRLVVEPVAVPLENYSALPVEDFMVSLYNDHTVPRVRIALADGTRRDVHAVLEAALAALHPHP